MYVYTCASYIIRNAFLYHCVVTFQTVKISHNFKVIFQGNVNDNVEQRSKTTIHRLYSEDINVVTFSDHPIIILDLEEYINSSERLVSY